MTHLDALLAGFSAAAPASLPTETRSLADLQRSLHQNRDPYEQGRLLAEIGALLGRRRAQPIENSGDLLCSETPRQLGGLLSPCCELLEQVGGTAVE